MDWVTIGLPDPCPGLNFAGAHRTAQQVAFRAKAIRSNISFDFDPCALRTPYNREPACCKHGIPSNTHFTGVTGLRLP